METLQRQTRPTMDALLKDGTSNVQARPTMDALLKDRDASNVKLDPRWTLS